MSRPIILGIVGDSAAGKTTLTRGIAQVLGPENVTMICTDDYHRYDRTQRAELGITALHPDCNYLDIMQQHLSLLRTGQPILKPVYSHKTGTFEPPQYIKPSKFVIIEGLLGYSTRIARDAYDVKVYLAPPEPLRANWKVKRDTQKRGYTPEQVLAELDKREPDSEAYIRPQRQWSDIVVSFYPPNNEIDETNDHLNVRLTLRPSIPHPDFTEIIHAGHSDSQSAIRLGLDRDMGKPVDVLEVDGHANLEQVSKIEHIMCEDMPHLKNVCDREINPELGKIAGTTGETLQSYPLALTQLIITYHMLKATQTY
ncbi:MAG: phosphoribulokinase [Anabaena sp. CoA2_C59]|jgi:phosphoribulokinase|uniref:Phosphoribulokinase n=3 Tax=Aphanizomenon flos-aquae TaxID=1176 RepID=A0A1B7VX71_APHFL|nr:phosphoribulokinase [Aphanizomenon flos-aquae Clear-A1]MBO1045505.1 phosphoribulokinase [Aphanizomenon flos-aquae UKL13-PB]MBO1062864.1 phosphoribulokinase [Aphanizomenon flos-aquae CP01]MCE2905245.1 phosphoribulokinase [Anabaena sp. CoA2_C59]MDJ0506565.1 phosphoribulokinase [Nostocales cyanobacterium LE14-WE12]OBQ19904.1 MAG: phosphoribulokinase [Anabaena sp. WA113]OBQ25513.1 MAG: phosphoribulokinase [Aphanizomenon flos-aquae LD13]OBQ27015.1 MAG: phosphoribulokinase [Aphanizomenon flos-a